MWRAKPKKPDAFRDRELGFEQIQANPLQGGSFFDYPVYARGIMGLQLVVDRGRRRRADPGADAVTITERGDETHLRSAGS